MHKTNTTANSISSSLTLEMATTKQQQPHHISSIPANTKICSASKHSLNESRSPLQCRICHSAGDLTSLPCHCKGTISSAHEHCLERWLNQSSTICCDLCGYQFNVETKLKYGCWESLRIWASNSTTKCLFRYDLLIFICVTMALSILMIQSILQIYDLIDLMKKKETTPYYDDLVFTIYLHLAIHMVFCAILFIAYIVNVTFICHTQIVPWFRWWRNSRYIKIVWPKMMGQIADV